MLELEDMTNKSAVRAIARMWHVHFVQWNDGECPDCEVAVLGLGAGLTMAFCDILKRDYPWLGVLAVDLNGDLGVQTRTAVLDYISYAYPSVWLLWCSLAPAGMYADRLRERDFHGEFAHGRTVWAYVKGAGASDADFGGMPIVMLDDIMRPFPLGSPQCLRAILSKAVAPPTTNALSPSQYDPEGKALW